MGQTIIFCFEICITSKPTTFLYKILLFIFYIKTFRLFNVFAGLWPFKKKGILWLVFYHQTHKTTIYCLSKHFCCYFIDVVF